MSTTVALDAINRRTWATPSTLRDLTGEATWSDYGEEAAFAWVADRCRGGPLLDIGVGAGRTIPLMRAISSNYTGIDYTTTLLDRARDRFPGADLRQMDARDMSELPSNHYALTAFSWNGIDCVSYDDRERILSEMFRVTRPGGLVLFSSHNRDGPGFHENPLMLLPHFTLNPLRLGWRVLRTLRQSPMATYNYMRHLHLHRDYEGYSIKSAAAHSFGIVIVYTTLDEQRRQLTELGFEIDAVFGSCDGKRIRNDVHTSDAFWMHFIARRPRLRN